MNVATEKKVAQKQCSHCQEEIPSAAKFCNYCGAGVEEHLDIENYQDVQTREVYLDQLLNLKDKKNISFHKINQLEEMFQKITKKSQLGNELKKLFPVENKYLNKLLTINLQTLLPEQELMSFFMEKVKSSHSYMAALIDSVDFGNEVTLEFFKEALLKKNIWSLLKAVKKAVADAIILPQEQIEEALMIEDEVVVERLLKYCVQVEIKLEKNIEKHLKKKYWFVFQKLAE